MQPAARSRLEARLSAEGRDCELWLVRDELDQLTVLKRLARSCSTRPDLAARLRFEGELLLELGGRHYVVQCHDVRHDPPELLLEYLPGGSLAARLADGPLDSDEACVIFRQLLDAATHLQANSVVHRDIKPSNVLFTRDGDARLVDFGVAARIGAPSVLGSEWIEERIGTLGYAAPEQLTEPVSPARPTADVYGLCVTLYEMLSGRLPFELAAGEEEDALRARITTHEARPPSLRPGTAAGLSAVIATGLRRDPNARWPDASALWVAFESALTGVR